MKRNHIALLLTLLASTAALADLGTKENPHVITLGEGLSPA